jgi:hypothetical protein
LYLSVSDLGRWLGWHLSAYPARSDAESGPLPRASIREMHDVSGGVGVHVTSPFSTLESWGAEPWAGGMALGWNRSSICDMGPLVEKAGYLDGYHTEVVLFPQEGIGIAMLSAVWEGMSLKRRAVFDVLKLLRQTGGVKPRVRRVKDAPALDRGLARLLEQMHQWNEAEYTAMLTKHHKRFTNRALEKAELEGYSKLHGRCTGGTLLSLESEARARYLVKCERGRLELDLSVSDGLIDGFRGISTEVDADPKAAPAAVLALGDPKRKESFGKCKLGKLKERSGLGWHRFHVSCERGPAELSLQVEAGAVKPDTLKLERENTSACAAMGLPEKTNDRARQ